MEYLIKNRDIFVKVNDFDLDDTLNCGQAFRWERLNSGADCAYTGYKLNNPLTISKKSDYFVFSNTTEDDFLNIWADYFDLYTDYSKIKEIISQDETIRKAILYADGIRILKQDSYEALISFIISQNNNIPRIKSIIKRFCVDDIFPDYTDFKDISADDLAYLRAGFRAKYLKDCFDKLNGGLNLDDIAKMPVDQARAALMTIKGVGVKVCDCVLLYGMYRLECFPVDVWIKRVLSCYYKDGLPDFIKEYAGIAQQYLFHYIRNNGE